MMASSTMGYNETRSKVHPKKFMLWVAIGSLCMMFAAYTSFYLVRKAAGNWLEFPLPSMFYTSTAIIVASSLAVHFSYRAFLAGNTLLYRGLLALALLLGMAFVGTQYMGWLEMNEMGIFLAGSNVSGSTIIVISAVHALHVLGGIGVLLMANLHAFLLPHKVTATRKLRFELTYTYWHFVDILWIYLLLFFLTQ